MLNSRGCQPWVSGFIILILFLTDKIPFLSSGSCVQPFHKSGPCQAFVFCCSSSWKRCQKSFSSVTAVARAVLLHFPHSSENLSLHLSHVKLRNIMRMQTEAAYKYLEPRPHRWRKILWIKGRNMHIWHLVATMLREGETPEQTAKNFGLPVEAVLEAIDYYQRNKDLADAETEEEGQRLRAKGLL